MKGVLLGALFAAVTLVTAAQTDKPDAATSADEGQPVNPVGGEDVGTAAKPSLLTPLKPVTEEAPYAPIRPRQRLRWFITNTIGPPHLVAGLFTASFGTAVDRPKEYGPHWGGFADRYGMRLTGIVTGNAMEASIGAFWGEDPRYFRVPDRGFKERLRNVARLTFLARQEDGSFGLAYARYAAVSGNNFLSNSWRPHSEANTEDALFRIGEGFAGRMGSNAFEEFWPDIKSHIFHRSRSGDE